MNLKMKAFAVMGGAMFALLTSLFLIENLFGVGDDPITQLRAAASRMSAEAVVASLEGYAAPTGTLVELGAYFAVAATLILIGAAWLLNRIVIAPIAGLRAEMAEMIRNRDARPASLIRKDEAGDLARGLADLSRQFHEAESLRYMLDSASSMVMLADLDYNIRYMNAPLGAMLSEAESDVRRSLPNFSTKTLIGGNIDSFHVNPGHQRRMLDALTGPHSTTLNLGGRRMKLNVNPVRDRNGARIGTMVEWNDATEELRVQAEIDSVISEAAKGSFKVRVNAGKASGSLYKMAETVNTLTAVVAQGLSETISTISALARGDLGDRMRGDYQGEFLRLKNDVNGLSDRLESIMASVQVATDDMRGMLTGIVEGAVSLSSRAEQQASALEETAATMEEMSATVRSNATNAAEANRIAQTSTHSAQRAGDVVKETVMAIERIESSSTKISEIIRVIDSIAFQTNLLALNAAVEAARAGDAGRGFAVVASEVRTLAQRSSDSATDIKTLIQDGESHVMDGVTLVRQTGDALEAILGSVRDLGQKVSEIAGASSEQSAGVDEITSNVSHLDEMTQKNSALAAESSAAARDAMAKLEELSQLLGFFRVRPASGATRHSRAA